MPMLTFVAGFKSRIKRVSLILQCRSERPEAKILAFVMIYMFVVATSCSFALRLG